MSLLHIRQKTRQFQLVKRDPDKSLCSLRGETLSPVRLGKKITQINLRSGNAKATAPDVFLFCLENRGPQAVVFFWPTKILVPESMQRFLRRPRSPTHVAAYFEIRLHSDKIGCVLRLVRPKDQTFCLKKNHRDLPRTVISTRTKEALSTRSDVQGVPMCLIPLARSGIPLATSPQEKSE
jgi:hypothetical protein